MLFPDITLARRLEFHEAWSSSEHARVQAQLFPETGANTLVVGDGRAVYTGKKSPLNRVYGWGLTGPVTADDLERVEVFYQDRGLKPHIRVCPLADPSLVQLLGEHGYIVRDHMNVYARQVGGSDDVPEAVPSLRIETATPDAAKLWFDLDNAGGDWAEPDGISFMLVRTMRKDDTQLFLAWLDGQLAGGGGLEIHNGTAALMAAATLPKFRKQGVHTALLHVRLAAAAKAGCDLAMIHTRPGAESQRNVLRVGFQMVYNVMTMVPSA